MNGGLLGFIQTVAQFVIGPFGISAITLAIGIQALRWAYDAVRFSEVGKAVVAGAILFSASWIVSTWLRA